MRGVWWGMVALGALAAAGSVFAADPQHLAVPTATPSLTCLECHDGLAAPNRICLTSAAAAALSPGTSAPREHPVGLDYLAAQAAGRTKLRPVSLLPPEIRLVDGRLECSSCHDVSADGAHRLVLEMAQSRLCFACHAL